jgi:integrase
MPINKLTDVQVRRAKPRERSFRLTDGGGLHLYITETGSKLWRMRYEYAGKEKLLSFGAYPKVALDEARRYRATAKEALDQGRDPSVIKKQRRFAFVADSANTFEAIAREWYGLQKPTWVPRHADDVLHSLERDVFPILGTMPIKEITPAMVLGVLREIENRPAIETAHRVRQRMSAVFVYAIASGRAELDPAAMVQKALAPIRRGRQPAVTNLNEARDILRKAEAVPSHPVTKLALRFLALTVVRPGTLIAAPWSEFAGLDETEPVWHIPAARMKLRAHLKDDDRRDHLVPLPHQAVEVIDALKTLTGRGPLVFPNTRHAHRPLSENAIGYLLNRAGYHHRHVPHGWRATFSTIMNERYPADTRIVDLMLAHAPKDKVEAAYNRAAYLARRRELAEAWADLLLVDQAPLEKIVRLPRR